MYAHSVKLTLQLHVQSTRFFSSSYSHLHLLLALPPPNYTTSGEKKINNEGQLSSSHLSWLVQSNAFKVLQALDNAGAWGLSILIIPEQKNLSFMSIEPAPSNWMGGGF